MNPHIPSTSSSMDDAYRSVELPASLPGSSPAFESLSTSRDSTNSFTNRGGLALLDQGIVSGASFVTSLLVGRYLGKDSLGIMFITLGIFTLLQCITDQLVHVPFLVRAPRLSAGRKRRYIGSSLVFAIVITSLASITIAATGLTLFAGDARSAQLGTMFFILSGLLPGMMLREFMHSMRHNQLRQFDAVILDACVAALQIALLIALILTNRMSVELALAAVGGAASMMALVRLPRLMSQLRVSPNVLSEDLKQNWIIGRWTLGSYLIGSSAPTLLPWLLAAMHGTASTGLLAACLTLFGIAQTFLRGAGKYMGPQMSVCYARGGTAELRIVIWRFTWLTLSSMTAIAAVLALGGEQLVRFAYGSQYNGTGAIMLWLAAGCWLQTIDVIAGNGLLALARSDKNFRADCLRFSVTLALAIALLPSLSSLGVVVALVLGMVSGLIARVAMLSKELRQADTILDNSELATRDAGVDVQASCAAP